MSTPGQMSLFASAAEMLALAPIQYDFASASSGPDAGPITTLVAGSTIAAGSVPTVTVNNSIPMTFPSGQLIPTVVPFNGTVLPAASGFWQAGITPVPEEMNQEDRRLGCRRCQTIKPSPKTPRALYYNIAGVPQVRTSPLGAGYCGQCGTDLIYVECDCKEPLQDEEMFCRNCGRNNAAELAKWGILDPPSTPEEEAARGQSSDEIFRGEREV
jgi:hypothetical protein